MKFMIFVIICFYSLSNHITNGKNLCSGNNNLKIERRYGLGDHWAIGYHWFYTMYKISISGMDDGNCKLTIKKGNENETFVINKNNKWQEKRYFRVAQPNSRNNLMFALSSQKVLDESFDNFSIYLNCRKEKCQVENIRVKNCSENGNYPNDQFKITYDKRSYGGNGNASCISGMLYTSGHLSESQSISVYCRENATWDKLENYECWKDTNISNQQNFNNTFNKQFNCYNSLVVIISAVITEIILLIGI